ncbi:MAG: RNA 2'-phosphotransferase [Kofleriaceae bacterium]|nr:RNA 2'-phosphotransferase [Kofleriaceae bacterium]
MIARVLRPKIEDRNDAHLAASGIQRVEVDDMNQREQKRISKFLSLVLRHEPEVIGVALDRAGWVEIATLIAQARAHGTMIDRGILDEVVAKSTKKRFSFSEDGLRIRANQGHSLEVELGYETAIPPCLLYHGTVAQFVPMIREQGIMKMQRHHVHLSPDRGTAEAVGQRRGKPVVLIVDALKMHEAGHEFFMSANGVWLTSAVPPQFIRIPKID